MEMTIKITRAFLSNILPVLLSKSLSPTAAYKYYK
jgi:hypothetical protein